MKIILYLISLSLLFSCASTPKQKFDALIKDNKCDEAALNIPSLEFNKVVAKAQTYSGTIASYTLASASYGIDAVLYVTGGIVVPAAACVFLVAKSSYPSASSSNGVIDTRAGQCFELVQRVTTTKTNLGKTVYEDTMKWRCPDVDYVTGYMKVISDCHLKNGEKEKAKTQLRSILTFKNSEKCLSEDEEEKIFAEINSIQI